MNVKKIVGLLLVAFVIFYVLSFPQESSNIVRSAVSGLGDAASNFADFVRSVFA